MIMKGLSTWLFSKVAMFVFLVSVFTIVIGMISIINERALSDSASVFTMNVRDTIQGVILTSSVSSLRTLAIPEILPENSKKANAQDYLIKLKFDDSENYIYSAMSWDVVFDGNELKEPEGYSASSLLYYPENIEFFGFDNDELMFESKGYRYIVVSRQADTVCIKACNKSGTEFVECTSDC